MVVLHKLGFDEIPYIFFYSITLTFFPNKDIAGINTPVNLKASINDCHWYIWLQAGRVVQFSFVLEYQ